MTKERTFPAVKPSWSEVPSDVVERLSEVVQGRIDYAYIAQGGIGQSATFVVRTVDGRKFFCKGNHPALSQEFRAGVRRERFLYKQLPELDSFRPAMQGYVECGDWELLVLEFLDRKIPVPPWTDVTLDACLDTLARLHASMPSHAQRLLDDAPWLQISRAQIGWRYLADHGAELGRLCSLFVNAIEAHRWLDRYLSAFADLEAQAADVQGPASWIHFDVRSDNLIFANHSKPTLLDWPLLSLGPVLMDVAFFLASVAGEAGPPPEEGLAVYQHKAGLRFDDHEVRVIVATIAGFFAARAGEPPISQLPRLRALQSLYLSPCLTWISRLMKIAPPPPLKPRSLHEI